MASIHLSNPIRVKETWQYEWFDPALNQMLFISEGYFYLLNFCDDFLAPKLFHHQADLPAQIIYAKISLDKQYIAVQLSPTSVLVLDIINKKRWKFDIRSSDSYILSNGIIWSDHGGSSQDLIVITGKGIELYKVSGKKGYCKLSRSILQQLFCFWYQPEHRMILTANYQSATIRGKALMPATLNSKGEVLLMDGFFLKCDKANMPTLELPPPDRINRFELGPGVSSDCIFLVSLYGLLIALVQYPAETEDLVTVYNITRSSTEKLMTLSLGYNPGSLSVSTFDNILLFHDSGKKQSLVFDIAKRPTGSLVTASVSCLIPPILITYTSVSNDVASADLRISIAIPSALPPSIKNFEGVQVRFLESQLASTHLSAYGEVESSDRFVPLQKPLPAYQFYSSVIYSIYQSGWAYDREQRIIWRISCNIYEVAFLSDDFREKASFLCRRGRNMVPARDESTPAKARPAVWPISTSNNEIAQFAKCSILRSYWDSIERKIDLVQLRILYDSFAASYVTESSKTTSAVFKGDLSTNADLRGVLKVSFRSAADAGVSTVASKSLQMQSHDISGTSTNNTASGSARKRFTIRESLTFNRPQSPVPGGGGDNRGGGESDGAFASEPIESSKDGEAFLPDISVIGKRVRDEGLRRRGLRVAEADADADTDEASIDIAQFQIVSSKRPQSVAPASLSMQVFSLRRDDRGELITSQVEVLSHVWIPILLSSHVDHNYCATALGIYISTFVDQNIYVISSLNVLHVTLLCNLGRFNEVANLLSMGFYSDSSDLSLILLQFSSILDEEMQSRDFSLRNSASMLGFSDEEYLNTVQSCKDSFQTYGLGMLWRSSDKITTVKWLLSNGFLAEGMELCSPRYVYWELTPGCIGGPEFYLSATNIVRRAIASERQGYQGLYTKLFYDLHSFLSMWDPSCLVVNQATGSSSLSAYAHFPTGYFDETVEQKLKSLFGVR